MNKKSKKNCKYCKKEFWIYTSCLKYRKPLFCSKKCLSLYCRKQREQICIVCKKKFDGKYSSKYGLAKYCSKNCMAIGFQGSGGSNWNGGKRTSKDGYIYIYKLNHPMAIEKNRYVAEHRLVMAKYLKRNLKSSEQVHHKNEIKNDNQLSKLELVATRPHHGKITCPFCNKNFLIQ